MEEAYFLVDSLETLNTADNIEDRSYKAVIYAVNQKGQSAKVTLRNFIVGDRSQYNSREFVHFPSASLSINFLRVFVMNDFNPQQSTLNHINCRQSYLALRWQPLY